MCKAAHIPAAVTAVIGGSTDPERQTRNAYHAFQINLGKNCENCASLQSHTNMF